MPVPAGSFFGASPELLVARHGTRVSSHPLAGTVPRGDTARTDADAQRDLAGSTKNRAEHRYVVEAIAAALAPFCEELSVPTEPSVVAFRSVAHLGTRVEGRLARPVGVLDLLRPLHPTPAVGGTPRAEALAFIEGHEAGDTGPLGRPGRVGRRRGRRRVDDRHPQHAADANGTTLMLRAGGGVVAGSDPDAEAGGGQREAGHRARCGGPRCLSAAAVSAPGAGGPAVAATCVVASGIVTKMVAPPCGEVSTAAAAVQRLGDGPHDGQAEPGPRGGAGRVALVEAVEDPAGLGRRDPRPVVGHTDEAHGPGHARRHA